MSAFLLSANRAALRMRWGTSVHPVSMKPLRWYSTEIERKPLFDKILIANRGEIACRIMRTAKKLGIKTVAVFSDADRNALHVKMADESYNIGPAASAESYLKIDKIIEVARKSGAQAIHPGYGFLSENAAFADRLAKENITFIGPPGHAMTAMGSKSESKFIMQAAKVPVVPGYHGANQDDAFLRAEAEKIGYPVLIKAVKGGGGKGMRIVERPEDFDLMLESSRREAMKSFSDDKVLVEKYLVTPRHVEVQVFADTLGNAVYLFERDCSVQRRHQKILEEAPAPGLSEELRRDLGEKAVAAAKAVNYVGAGTVEFIMDNTDQKFYFMEMNTRLQVEHPITEMITNTDLVQWQLEVAAGNRLPKLQDELKMDGWSFEARIYAENPSNNFLPDVGPLLHVRTPEASESVRLETGFVQGDEISVHYDPMIAKLVVHGENRTAALRILRKALSEYEVVGLNTNIEFLKTLASHPAFIAGEVETGFIKKYEDTMFKPAPPLDPAAVAQASLSLVLRDLEASKQAAILAKDGASPFTALPGLRLNQTSEQQLAFKLEDQDVKVGVEFNHDGTFNVRVQTPNKVTLFEKVMAKLAGESSIISEIENHRCKTSVVLEGDQVHVFSEDGKVTLDIPQPKYLTVGKEEKAGSLRTPMPCKISQVMCKPGDKVIKGQALVILEAMKMEHIIKSPIDGVVSDVFFNIGDMVAENKSLIAFKETEENKA
ncbi:Methylcrotonoyl-CoA carboxylase subunit alpha, mitochondrial [Lunasporangiospora selenospora]|uniref:Methylcrotonoyl-CoA carboxylase subunit alpha, mitochondrial n=1 Tax=Lunasporangiospora selenospora TaxID=979761 RepID=A0A9P6KI16_9FUNG|nr:Methylcrotonoyl-CoA carboxylase subunit alpha, mitochondrial [Lunasporangiospora selenospora]